MNRKCPGCSSDSVSVTGLILSDVQCLNCGRVVGIQWAFRAVFFILILVATVITAVAVLIEQGLYATLLIVTLPIGAIGIIKARYCPLVLRKQGPGVEDVKR